MPEEQHSQSLEKNSFSLFKARKLFVFPFLPHFRQFPLIFLCPILDHFLGAQRQIALDHFERLNFKDAIVFAVYGMEMGNAVLAKIHLD